MNAFFFIAGYLHRKETVLGGSFQIPLPLPYHPIVIFKTKNKRNQNKSKEENNYQWSVVTTTDKTDTHARVTSWGGSLPYFGVAPGMCRFRTLRLKQGIEHPASLGREPFKERQDLRWVVYMRWYVAKITYPGCTGSSSRSVEYALGSSSWINM